MKLASVQSGKVVRNLRNGSYYRVERPEKSRMRIRPLELFPNGLLIEKITDTLVEGDLDVEVLADWTGDLTVDGPPTRSRPAYEKELITEEARLIILREEYTQLPSDGKGKFSRGSHANKVKNCAARIEVLRRGLGFLDGPAPVVSVGRAPEGPLFSVDQLVQLPSGLPALTLGFQEVAGAQYAKVRTKIKDAILEGDLPCEVLRPWEQARRCSV